MTEKETGITLYDWLDTWLEIYNKPIYKENTFLSHSYMVKTIKSNVVNKMLSDFTDMELQILINKMYSEGYAKATLCKIRTILKFSFRQALRNHQIDRALGQDIIIPVDAPVKEIEALTREEQRIVEQAAASCVGGNTIIFLLYSGLRRCELMNLKWADYNPTTGYLQIRKSKTKSGIRTIFLPQKAKAIIDGMQHKSEYIFTTQTNYPYNYTSMKRVYMRIRKITGIMTFTTHICRHTFATRLAEEGVNPKAIADLLGHKKVEYAWRIYIQLDKLKSVHEVEKLDQLNL